MFEIIKYLGIMTIGTTSFFAFLGYVFKKFFEYHLANNAEELKVTRQIFLHDRQIKNSKLQDERGEIIKDLYGQLLDYKISIISYLMVLSVGGDEPSRRSAQINWQDKGLKFHNIYTRNRIFFSSTFCELCDNLREEIKSINIQISHYLNNYNLSELLKSETGEAREYLRLINKAQKDIELKVNPLLTQLEEQFREMLGVEK